MKSSRPAQKLKAHLKAAYAYSELSHAKRLKVGAVLVKDDRIISIGYNGTVTGGSNVLEEYVQEGPVAELVTKPEVLHAEENCIAFAAKTGISTEGCIMVTTDSPCFACSRLMIQAGIKAVYYHRPYRITEGIDFLQAHGVKVERIYLHNGKTKEESFGEGDVQTFGGLSEDISEDQIRRQKEKDENNRLRRFSGTELKDPELQKVIKAFGNCLKCYGKGYGTVLDFTHGAADFPGDVPFDHKNPVLRYCTCERGEALKELVGDNHK